MARRCYTKSELKSLLQRKNACVTLKKCTFDIWLHPFYYPNNLKEGLLAALYDKVKKYETDAEGILLGYEKMTVDEGEGRIVGIVGYIKYPAVCNCYVFYPIVGQLLEGIVNKISPDHIGVLVHKYFNVTIKRPELEPYEHWNNRPIDFGDELVFRVKDIDYTGILPFIEGELDEEPWVSAPVVKKAASSESGVEDVHVPPTQKAAKRKREDFISSTQLPGPENESFTTDSGFDFDFLSPIAKKPKAKKSKTAQKNIPVPDSEDDDNKALLQKLLQDKIHSLDFDTQKSQKASVSPSSSSESRKENTQGISKSPRRKLFDENGVQKSPSKDLQSELPNPPNSQITNQKSTKKKTKSGLTAEQTPSKGEIVSPLLATASEDLHSELKIINHKSPKKKSPKVRRDEDKPSSETKPEESLNQKTKTPKKKNSLETDILVEKKPSETSSIQKTTDTIDSVVGTKIKSPTKTKKKDKIEIVAKKRAKGENFDGEPKGKRSPGKGGKQSLESDTLADNKLGETTSSRKITETIDSVLKKERKLIEATSSQKTTQAIDSVLGEESNEAMEVLSSSAQKIMDTIDSVLGLDSSMLGNQTHEEPSAKPVKNWKIKLKEKSHAVKIDNEDAPTPQSNTKSLKKTTKSKTNNLAVTDMEAREVGESVSETPKKTPKSKTNKVAATAIPTEKSGAVEPKSESKTPKKTPKAKTNNSVTAEVPDGEPKSESKTPKKTPKAKTNNSVTAEVPDGEPKSESKTPKKTPKAKTNNSVTAQVPDGEPKSESKSPKKTPKTKGVAGDGKVEKSVSGKSKVKKDPNVRRLENYMKKMREIAAQSGNESLLQNLFQATMPESSADSN